MGYFKEDGYKRNAHNASHDEYATPWPLVRFWEDYIGRKFTLDPASSTTNHKARTFLTKRDNGLTSDWGPNTCLLNPPFSNGGILRWTTRSVDAARWGALVLGVLPNWVNDPWAVQNVKPFASELFFIEGRIRFLGANGKPGFQPTFGSVVVIWRPGLRPAGTDLKVDWIRCPLR
jgi:hypothetical protein